MVSDSIHLFGCIHLPDFPVQAALRSQALLSLDEVRTSFRTVPVAVLDGPDSLLKVAACNKRARKLGIWTGMTKLQAEACVGIELRKRVTEDEALAHRVLIGCGYAFASRVESTCPGTVILDLTGAERLLGAAPRIAQQLAERSEEAGFEANIGMAANPDAACCAARGNAGTTIIAAGEEARRLGGLPVKILGLEPEVLDTLESWGIRDFKSLAALPHLALSQRMGQHGLHLQRLARGEVQRELVPAEPQERFQESIEMEEAIELLEPLGFVLNSLLEKLMARLKGRSLATDEVRVDLELEVHADRQVKDDALPETGEPVHQSRLKLPVPTQDGKVLLKLLQLDLAEHPPWAPVRKVAIEVMPANVRTTQTNLFQSSGPEPAKLEITLARLRAVVGETDEEGRGLVGFPVVLDSHRPDSFAVLPTYAPQRNNQNRRKRADAPLLPMRMFRPPVGARVEIRDNAPVAIVFNGTKGKVTHASGPWRSGGEWWSARDAWQREEWDVEVAVSGGKSVYRIFRETQSGEWFVQGMYG
ncbi:MAG TPA: DNA polymerase Y family protein [Candidatus Binatia bacterium]|nr:DNA polymerase Y family protein [Candidatus Binatia bacterium]